MRLLVSVATADEAAAALEGGAHIIDAKDPARSALGAVTPDTFQAICARVGALRPISAALGDGGKPDDVAADAQRCRASGAAFVKIGFARICNERHVAHLIDAARAHCPVVAVGYADATRVEAIDPAALIGVAARAGATGVLLDTADKNGPGLRELMSHAALQAWVHRAQGAGLQVAVAGKLTNDDMPWILRTGADIAGVRGAACDGGRTGRVVSAQVRALVDLIGSKRDHAEPGRQRFGEVAVHHVPR
jgi:(5-formylfuran-3-yl)methyl phosphate synthase